MPTSLQGRLSRIQDRMLNANILFTLLIFFFILALIYPMLANDHLFGRDPWRHYFYSRFGEAQSFFSNQVQLRAAPTADSYPTVLRSNLYLFSTLTGIDAYSVIRFFTIFQRVVYFLLVYAVLQAFTGRRRAAVIGGLLAMTSYYFVWRSSQTWPENQAVLMHLLALWAFERYRQTRSRRDLAVIGLAVVGAIYTHPPSLWFLGFIFAGYGLLAFLERDWDTLRKYLLVAVIGVVLALPSIAIITKSFVHTLTSNLGDESIYAPIARQQSRYDPIELFGYQSLLGTLMFALTVLGVIAILRGEIRPRLPLLVVFGLGFVLTLSTHYNLYIPPNRTMGYFYLAAIVVAMLGIEALLEHMPRRWLRLALVGLVAVTALMMVIETPVYDDYSLGEVETAALANRYLEQHPGEAVGFYGHGAPAFLLENPEAICLRMQQRVDGRYDTRRPDEGNTRCEMPALMIASSETIRAVPGYTQVAVRGIYTFWLRRDAPEFDFQP
ncbi:MAG: glycosyltransferase family 39 protein [Chloroflexi bacterium]|nr:glycosyltransferase family 39 protein [Chloroflexota bacterium]